MMQASLLLVNRNITGMREYSSKFLRTSNLLESRRNSLTKTFLSGPASDLLAPSFGAWKLPNGNFAHSHLAGLSVTYGGVLVLLIEIEKMLGNENLVTVYKDRLQKTKEGLTEFFLKQDQSGNTYLVRSIDPD
eukprot:gene25345-11127_t